MIPTPLFSVMCFAVGYGPAPLLLVIVAPFLTEHISTALGLHKSLEMAGSTLMQTVYCFVIELISSTPDSSSISKQQAPGFRLRLFSVKYISSGYSSDSIFCMFFPSPSSCVSITHQTTAMWSMRICTKLKKDTKHWNSKAQTENTTLALSL